MIRESVPIKYGLAHVIHSSIYIAITELVITLTSRDTVLLKSVPQKSYVTIMVII